MELFFIIFFLILFLYVLFMPVARFLKQERNQRRFSKEALSDAEKMFHFSDGEFLIMVYRDSENQYFRTRTGEEHERRNSSGG